MKYMKPDGSLI